jgi:hypothetical protein
MKMADINTSNIKIVSAETAKPAARCYFSRFTVCYSLTLSVVGIAEKCQQALSPLSSFWVRVFQRPFALTFSLLVCLWVVLRLKNTSLAFALKYMWKPHSEILNTSTCVICTDLTEHLKISNQCTFYFCLLFYVLVLLSSSLSIQMTKTAHLLSINVW